MTEDPGVESSGAEGTPSVTATSLRNALLECLQEFDEPVSLPDLADEIAVREDDETLSDISGERVKEIYLSLYHQHVPALATEGLIEYDQDADLVRISDGAELGADIRSGGEG